MFKKSVLSTAIAASLFSISPTFAQDNTADDTGLVVEEVIVTGIKASLKKGLDIKRDSMQLVDAIVAEDIGKFPDNNVVEALQRIPGVQVTDRGQGEVNSVSIRGLTDVTTTVNGRQVFTASGRSVALADIPASLLSGVDVYKTRSADLTPSGIAGQIDIHTQRPFNFDGFKVVGSVKGTYMEEADSTDPNLGFLLSNNWETGAGKFGALVNVSYAETNYRDQGLTPGAVMPFTTDTPHANLAPYEIIRPVYNDGAAVDPEYYGVENWVAGTEQGLPFAEGSTMTVGGDTLPYVLSRDAIFQNDFTGKRERPAANISLQFAPNENSEYIFEAFYNGYRNESFNNLLFSFVDWWGSLPADPASTITLYPGTNVVKERSIIPNVYGFNSGDLTVQKTDSFVYALGGQWDVGDKLHLEGEVVLQNSKFENSFLAMRTDRVAPSISVDFNDKNGLPAFSFGDNPDTVDIDESDLTNPALWNVAQLYDNGFSRDGDAFTLTFDGEYEADWGFIRNVRFGLRNDKRGASDSARGTEGFCGCPMAGDQFDEGLQYVNEDFYSGEADVPSTWVVANGHYIWANRSSFHTLYNDVELARNPTIDPVDLPFTAAKLTLGKNFDIDETTTDLYITTDIELGNLDGEVGLRYTNVDTDMTFFSGNLPPASESSSYSKLLPSIALRYNFSDDLQARFAYTETFRQPEFGQLNAYVNYVADVTNIGYGTATGGNPDLEPTSSTNIDLSLEWYFGDASSVFGTLFSRDVEGFVFDSLSRVEYQGPGDTEPYPYVLLSPQNSSDGELTGAELGVVVFPDNWGGFGVQASYTKMFNSTQDLPNFNDDGSIDSYFERSIFGVSEDSYSIVLAYDIDFIEARLSYVWRDDFLNNYDAPLFANPRGVYRRPETSIDFQFSYDITEDFTLTLDATNLAGEIYQSYYEYPDIYNFGNAIYSRTFALGVRFSL